MSRPCSCDLLLASVVVEACQAVIRQVTEGARTAERIAVRENAAEELEIDLEIEQPPF